MGHKIKGRKPECPHLNTKTKTTKTLISEICKDCGMTISITARSPKR